MKVATYIAQFIKEKGINTVFELQGGMITRLLDEFNKHGGFNIVSMHHEQAAAFAADAFGRITGKPGIALGTSTSPMARTKVSQRDIEEDSLTRPAGVSR